MNHSNVVACLVNIYKHFYTVEDKTEKKTTIYAQAPTIQHFFAVIFVESNLQVIFNMIILLSD